MKEEEAGQEEEGQEGHARANGGRTAQATAAAPDSAEALQVFPLLLCEYSTECFATHRLLRCVATPPLRDGLLRGPRSISLATRSNPGGVATNPGLLRAPRPSRSASSF